MSNSDNEKDVLIAEGISFRLDQAGYLLDLDSWNRAFAEAMAIRAGIQLRSVHWQLIEFARNHYQRYDDSPSMRALVKWARRELGGEKGNSRYLYRLFPQGPGKQLSLLAGLPKPVSCI